MTSPLVKVFFNGSERSTCLTPVGVDTSTHSGYHRVTDVLQGYSTDNGVVIALAAVSLTSSEY